MNRGQNEESESFEYLGGKAFWADERTNANHSSLSLKQSPFYTVSF